MAHTSIPGTRDPSDRTQTVRRIAYTNETCSWCGQVSNKTGRMFEYGTENDNWRVEWHKGRFCSKSCHDIYHDVR